MCSFCGSLAEISKLYRFLCTRDCQLSAHPREARHIEAAQSVVAPSDGDGLYTHVTCTCSHFLLLLRMITIMSHLQWEHPPTYTNLLINDAIECNRGCSLLLSLWVLLLLVLLLLWLLMLFLFIYCCCSSIFALLMLLLLSLLFSLLLSSLFLCFFIVVTLLSLSFFWLSSCFAHIADWAGAAGARSFQVWAACLCSAMYRCSSCGVPQRVTGDQ